MLRRLLLLMVMLALVPACADRRKKGPKGPPDDPKHPVLLHMPRELPKEAGEG